WEVTSVVERVYGKAGRPSICAVHGDWIQKRLELGLTAQRIYQDLVTEVQFSGSYQAVKRYVRQIKTTSPLPFCRVEVEPAEEAQVDFGSGAPIVGEDG